MGLAAATWVEAVVALDGARPSATRAGEELEACYGEPHRHYHTIEHINAVLRDARWLGEFLGLSQQDQAMLDLAVCAHDVIYTCAVGDDERASAGWASSRLLESGVSVDTVDRVSDAVLATITHTTAKPDRVTECLLDADLAILGTSQDEYDRYVANVRLEYPGLDDEAWMLGRSRVLRRLMERPTLYLTVPACERWDLSARANLGRELHLWDPEA